jgi:preprotein translocase subunit YajC
LFKCLQLEAKNESLCFPREKRDSAWLSKPRLPNGVSMFRFVVSTGLAIAAFAFSSLFSPSEALAQAAPAAGPNQMLQFVPIIFAFVVMIVYTNYANKKKQSQRGDFLSKLERGTEVVTQGGILGRIEGLTELYLTLEIAPGTRIRVLRSAVAGLAKNVTTASATLSDNSSGVKS